MNSSSSRTPTSGIRASLNGMLSVERLLLPLAELLWPELKQMSGQRRLIGAGEVLSFIFSVPFALIGLIWLVIYTDISVIQQNWVFLLAHAGLMYLFRRLNFFMITEIRPGRYASSDGSMESMVLWAGVLLVGPNALWLAVLLALLDFVGRWNTVTAAVDRWSRVRSLVQYLVINTLAALLAFEIYLRLGGQIPISGLDVQALLPVFGALLVFFFLQLLLWSSFLAYAVWTQKRLSSAGSAWPLVSFMIISVALPNLSHPFGAMMAGAYVQNGPATYLVFLLGLLLVAIISRQFSWAVENNRQKSRQLEKLEMLARAILVAPPDASSLAQILSEHIPSMFPSGRVAVWINQDQILALHPDDWDPDTDSIWEWLQNQTEARSFLSHESLPWNPALENHRPVVAAPVIEVDSGKPLGGVYLELYSLTQPWDTRSLTNLYPAIQALAAQIASALHQAEFYSQALAYQKVSQELVLAGRIQASFLPDEVPTFSGWQIAVTLLPARETSGDYFDLIPLTNGKLGILIADVTDKGIGAALYMALSRTLIRTYAIEFDEDAQPDVIFFAANNRLLRDARADLFVTTFYGILDPETGELSFCNAGHNPPYLVRRASGDPDILPLHPTGMPIGVEEDTVWSLQTVRVDPGDVLVLYTDGIPDSQNIQGEFFGEELLISSVLASAGQSADEIQESILENVMSFSEGASQFDDITLLVLVRDEELGPDEEQALDDDLAPEEYIVRDGDLLRDEDLEPDEDV